jgi:glycosyltransferase involved in cell wall biosynthesis
MKKILFLLHIPPPVHGTSIVGQSIQQSTGINHAFNCRYLNILLSRELHDTGKIGMKKAFTTVWSLILCLKEIILFRPDACYLAVTVNSSFAFYRDVIFVAMLRLFGVKRIFHLHHQGAKDKQHSSIGNALSRFLFHDAEVIILSKNLYNDIEAYVPENRTHVIPNGIEFPNIKDSTNLFKEQSDILFLSNLLEAKGVYVLLEACQLLKRTTPQFNCVLIGGKGDISPEALQAKIQALQLENQVRYVGVKYGEEKYRYLTAAGMFVLPTLKEAFPLVLIEAIQFGLPVISTNEGGITDIVIDGKNGFIVPKGDATALAEKMAMLLKNEEIRTTMGACGRQLYQEKFTLEKFESNLSAVLQLTLEK